MEILIAGLIVFFGTHLIPTFQGIRTALRSKLGEKPYQAIYSLISLVGFGLIVFGMGRADFIAVYDPPDWGRHVTGLFMLLALYCLISSEIETNFRRASAHPMLWGFALWSLGHLLANGDLASLLLFGSFLIFAFFDMASANRRGARPSGPPVHWLKDVKAIMLAVVVLGVMVFLHPYIAGMPIY